MPPFFSSRCIAFTVFRFCFIFAGFSAGSSSMCFLECTHSRFLPMLKGLHSRSVTTRSPATYVMDSPSPGCVVSVRSGMNAASPSLWWLPINTTFSPASSAFWIAVQRSGYRRIERSNSTSDPMYALAIW